MTELAFISNSYSDPIDIIKQKLYCLNNMLEEKNGKYYMRHKLL